MISATDLIMDEAAIRQVPQAEHRPSQRPNWMLEVPVGLWDPPRRLIQCLRDYTRARRRGDKIGLLYSKLAVVRHRFWSAITGADIPIDAWDIGGGLEIPHPNGIVIHPGVRIGPNCRLYQQVTLGTGPEPGLPTLGANVDIGAGAKILGGVHLGDFSVVGANAVVITDVPAGATAVGVPAIVKVHARGRWEHESRRGRGAAAETIEAVQPLKRRLDGRSDEDKLGFPVAEL